MYVLGFLWEDDDNENTQLVNKILSGDKTMKKSFVLITLFLSLTGLAVSGSLDLHVGAGYHASLFQNLSGLNNNFEYIVGDAKTMLLGVGVYAGAGYRFGRLLSVGGEFAPSLALSLAASGNFSFNYQARAYLKLTPIPEFTASVLAGIAGNIANRNGEQPSHLTAPVIGLRITAFFIYGEYATQLRVNDSLVIAKHELGLGFAFLK